jgi:hypothetical protein
MERKSNRRLAALAVLLALSGGLYCTVWGADKYKTLALEDRTMLRVGQLAVLSIPSDHQYRIDSEGDALELVRRTKNKAVLRAIRPGRETILLSPEVPDGECISCTTHHYFITVAKSGDTDVE